MLVYPLHPLCSPPYFFFGASFADGGGAAGAAFAGAFGASVCLAAPPMMSSRLSPFLLCAGQPQCLLNIHWLAPKHHLTHLVAVAVPPCAKLCSEGRQFTGLVLFYIQQFLTTGIP